VVQPLVGLARLSPQPVASRTISPATRPGSFGASNAEVISASGASRAGRDARRAVKVSRAGRNALPAGDLVQRGVEVAAGVRRERDFSIRSRPAGGPPCAERDRRVHRAVRRVVEQRLREIDEGA